MSTNYPTSKDSLTNPTSTDKEDSVSVPHAAQHANSNDAIEALQTKLGIDSSSDTNSIDYFLKHASGTFESHNHSNNGAQIVTAGIADDAVGPTKIAETGWGASSGEMLNFVPRDVATGESSDFDINDFTIDGNFYSLDLSSIIPEEAVSIYFQLQIKDDATESYFMVRKNSSTKEYVVQRTQVAGVRIDSAMISSCANQAIDYKISPDLTLCFFTITGWWEPAHT